MGKLLFCFKFQVSSFKVMSRVDKFEDLDIFQKARVLCKDVYILTEKDPWRFDTRFVQQIHAAVGSVMDNIAEGYERDGNKEFVNFLYIAKGSCGEVRSQIIRALDVGYIEEKSAQKIYNDCINLNKLIYSLIKKLKDSDVKGLKYKGE